MARSAERSYESLSLNDMMSMFMINDKSQLMTFIASNNNKGKIEWQVSGDRLFFIREKRDAIEIPNVKMMNISLEYATELNRII